MTLHKTKEKRTSH